MRQGWEIANLGEVCEMINRGIAPKYIDDGGICVINQKCIRNHTINTALARRHDPAVKPINSERYIQVGDVLINSTGTGTLGRVAQVRKELNEPTTVDTHVTIVRPHSGRFFNDFFGYMLVRIEDEIASSGEGASGQTELARSAIAEKFKVSFPSSISEQELIVSIVDQAFEGIDRAIANTKKNLANARELFEGYLNTIFTQEGEGWIEKNLGETCYFSQGIQVELKFQSETFKNGTEVRFLRIVDFTQGNVAPRYIENPGDKYIVNENDISLVRYGASTGFVCRGLNGAIANNLFKVIPSEDSLLNGYLYYFLCSPAFQNRIKSVISGAAMPAISFGLIKNIKVLLPSGFKQGEIVKMLDVIRYETQRLEAIYQQKLAALNELKQSILQKAFTGELTADTANQTTKKAEEAIAA